MPLLWRHCERYRRTRSSGADGQPALEVHRYTTSWYWDQEIFDEVARHLPYLRSVTCRLYCKLDQMKQAGDDWRECLSQHLYDEDDAA